MVIEAQKDTLESTESSLEKQEENIQDVAAVESELEEYPENINDISKVLFICIDIGFNRINVISDCL